jgi:DNA-binding NtrC family response regulator
MTKRSTAILLIDDDRSQGLATVDLLAAHGHRPTLAVSAEQAAELLTAPHHIDVVILDLQLGAERGEWLIDKLRHQGARVPAIVIFSARPLPELTVASKFVKAECILMKPCSAQRLLEAVELAQSSA